MADPLPSWNDGPAKFAIVEFVSRVTSTKALRTHAKYTVKFRLADSQPVQRLVKLYLPSELH